MKYSISMDGERYYGDYPSLESAITAGLFEACEMDRKFFYVGESRPPIQPELYWSAEDWLEHVACQDEYCGDYAEGWDQSTKEERSSLEDLIQNVLGQWLDSTDNRPKFWIVDNAQKYEVCDDGTTKKVKTDADT